MNILRKQSGFTLLELLLVVFLLGVLAMTSFAVVQDGDDQQRFDATKTYYQLIKKAIIGDPTLTLNGEADVSGFVADMGRLPNCLRELVEPLDCTPDKSAAVVLQAWAQDPDSQVWSGWRGPYLQGIPESGVGLAFRDGWKNTGNSNNTGNDDDVNYGWLYGEGAANGTACSAAIVGQAVPNKLIIQSCGSDSSVGGVDYGQDYPPLYLVDHDSNSSTPMILRPPPMVVESDYSVTLGDAWDSIGVEFFGGSGDRKIDANTLRLRVNYPNSAIDGNGREYPVDWRDTEPDPEVRDAALFLSETFPANAVRVPSETGAVTVAGKTVNISIPSTLSAGVLTIPNDADLTLDPTGTNEKLSLVNCPCVVNVADYTTGVGTGLSSVVFDSGGTMTVQLNQTRVFAEGLLKPYIVIPIGSSLDSTTQITLPNGATLTFAQPYIGVYSPIIILDSSDSNITVSEAFTRTNNTIITSSSNDQFTVTDGTTATGNVLDIAARSSVPIGRRSLTIVCEQFGTNFDGNCADDATANNPVATPYSFTVKPRATITPPSALRWQVN